MPQKIEDPNQRCRDCKGYGEYRTYSESEKRVVLILCPRCQGTGGEEVYDFTHPKKIQNEVSS